MPWVLKKENEVKRVFEKIYKGREVRKVEYFTTGKSGRYLSGENARGHWETRGFVMDGVIYRSWADLVEEAKCRTQ